ncbi:hypothetical protein BDV19DRAFT_388557 [Aspergillus venezuelensis]
MSKPPLALGGTMSVTSELRLKASLRINRDELWSNDGQLLARNCSYRCQAPEDEPVFEDTEDDTSLVGHLNYTLNDVYTCIMVWTPETQALLAKCIVALVSFDGRQSHLTQDISMLLPLAENCATNTNQGPQDQNMDIDGTVLFTHDAPKLIIDDRTLETGLALWVDFANNGAPERVYRVQMLVDDFPYLFLGVYSNWDPLRTVLDYMGEDKEHDDPDVVLEDQPVNMRRPFAEVYLVGTYDGANGHER